MKVICGILLVLIATVYSFAADPTEAEKQAATEAFKKFWDESYREAVALFPAAADKSSELSKAVRADIATIHADPAHQLHQVATLPMILVQKHAARLGISPRIVAGVGETPVVPEQKSSAYSVDDEARIIQLMLAGLSRAKAESLVAGHGGSAVPNSTSESHVQRQQRVLDEQARREREAQLRGQARDDQLTDEQRRTADRLARERRQAELNQMQIGQQRLDRQLRDERLRREREEAERQRDRDRN